MDEQRLKQLEDKVRKLEEWKAQREGQQIVFPLDNQSQTILGKYFLQQIAVVKFEAGASGNPFRTILVQQANGPISEITTSTTLIPFSVSTSADTVLLGNDLTNLKQGQFEDDTLVSVRSTGTLPSPLSSTTDYYVVNASSNDTVIQLSLTSMGAAINITDTGTGQHFIYAF